MKDFLSDILITAIVAPFFFLFFDKETAMNCTIVAFMISGIVKYMVLYFIARTREIREENEFNAK
ncbi:hypothetical protein [Dubosiella newyorkensis]|uniref:hypothetical protein n=1 Tax=Dubosiella newyorkensis TaxID=1862672 RepID=UPI0025B5BB90|nr:hypothetical protein [Dubosiella newyorkensis]